MCPDSLWIAHDGQLSPRAKGERNSHNQWGSEREGGRGDFPRLQPGGGDKNMSYDGKNLGDKGSSGSHDFWGRRL